MMPESTVHIPAPDPFDLPPSQAAEVRIAGDTGRHAAAARLEQDIQARRAHFSLPAIEAKAAPYYNPGVFNEVLTDAEHGTLYINTVGKQRKIENVSTGKKIADHQAGIARSAYDVLDRYNVGFTDRFRAINPEENPLPTFNHDDEGRAACDEYNRQNMAGLENGDVRRGLYRDSSYVNDENDLKDMAERWKNDSARIQKENNSWGRRALLWARNKTEGWRNDSAATETGNQSWVGKALGWAGKSANQFFNWAGKKLFDIGPTSKPRFTVDLKENERDETQPSWVSVALKKAKVSEKTAMNPKPRDLSELAHFQRYEQETGFRKSA